MRVVVFEDERPAAQKLKKLLQKADSGIQIIETIDTVEKGIDWLNENQQNIDLLFMDVNLADGICFEIFKEVKVYKPVIFTTAFNQYALDAFSVNSIDYLLKPVSEDKLKGALQKFQSIKESFSPAEEGISISQINKLINKLDKTYKTRFMIKVGEHIRPFTTNQIALFYSEGRNVCLVTEEGRQYVVDYKMEELEEKLDPEKFYRVSRSFIMNFDFISDVVVYSSSRLKIKPSVNFDREIIVSREKTGAFKTWLSGQE